MLLFCLLFYFCVTCFSGCFIIIIISSRLVKENKEKQRPIQVDNNGVDQTPKPTRSDADICRLLCHWVIMKMNGRAFVLFDNCFFSLFCCWNIRGIEPTLGLLFCWGLVPRKEGMMGANWHNPLSLVKLPKLVEWRQSSVTLLPHWACRPLIIASTRLAPSFSPADKLTGRGTRLPNLFLSLNTCTFRIYVYNIIYLGTVFLLDCWTAVMGEGGECFTLFLSPYRTAPPPSSSSGSRSFL